MATQLKEAVQKVMEDKSAPEIASTEKAKVTEQLVENTIKFMSESQVPVNQTGGVSNYDQVLIKMVRRAAPKTIAFDLMGVQPMTGPVGSIFAMRNRYTSQTGTEAGFNEADTSFSGTGTHAGDTSGFAADAFGAGDPATGTSTGTGMTKAAGELLGSDGNPAWAEMAFSVERVDVSAKTRKLKATYSDELARDFKAIHNMDAEAELANILSTEIITEIDREMIRTVNISAKLGGVSGKYDLASDADGRWFVEKIKGLIFQIELEANQIAKETRRGRGNRIICSSNVAAAFNMAGLLDASGLSNNLAVDDTGVTYAGVLNGKYQVYIDPYATVDYVTVGYKGANAWDAGIYYCPYVPLEFKRATHENTFNNGIGFATRYGVIANPFASTEVGGAAKAGLGLGQGENEYFRKFRVNNITG